MKNFRFAFAGLLFVLAPLDAQVFTFTKDQMVKYTAKNPFERFQVRLSEWEIENASAVKQRVLYESPVIPSVSEGSGGRAAR